MCSEDIITQSLQDLLWLGSEDPKSEPRERGINVLKVDNFANHIEKLVHAYNPETASKLTVIETYILLRSESSLFNIINASKLPLEDVLSKLKGVLKDLCQIDFDLMSLLVTSLGVVNPGSNDMNDINLFNYVGGKCNMRIESLSGFVKPENLSVQEAEILYKTVLQIKTRLESVMDVLDGVAASLYKVKPSRDGSSEYALGIYEDFYSNSSQLYVSTKKSIDSQVDIFSLGLEPAYISKITSYFVEALMCIANTSAKLNVSLIFTKFELAFAGVTKNINESYTFVDNIDVKEELEYVF